MKTETFEQILATDPVLSQHQPFLRSIAKPCVDIRFGGEAPALHQSRYGGPALVPQGFAWPTHEMGQYLFLGQIDFAEIANPPQPLPSSGLLSLFYAYDEDGAINWWEPGYVLGYYWPDTAKLVGMDSPHGDRTAVRKLQFSAGVDIPRHRYMRKEWPFDPDAVIDLNQKGLFPSDYLLGYPSYYTLAYDPTPKEPGWISLLTLKSHDEFDWCWHDGDKLMVFIEADKLAACDFSELRADAG